MQNIKLLKLRGDNFFPLTVAEAVLVKESESSILTLNDVLDKKTEHIITPLNSGLNSYRLGKNVVITHSNLILASESVAPVLIKYDSNGHIVESSPMGSLIVTLDGLKYSQYNGLDDSTLQFGPDFDKDNNNNIILKWNNV